MNKLHHTLRIEHQVAGADNEYGDPTVTWETTDTVAGLVQPLRIRELQQIGQGGPVASDYRIFVYPVEITEADRVYHGDQLYHVDAVHDAGGAAHHYELLAHRVTA